MVTQIRSSTHKFEELSKEIQQIIDWLTEYDKNPNIFKVLFYNAKITKMETKLKELKLIFDQIQEAGPLLNILVSQDLFKKITVDYKDRYNNLLRNAEPFHKQTFKNKNESNENEHYDLR